MKQKLVLGLMLVCSLAFAQTKQMPDADLPAVIYFSQIDGNKPKQAVIGEIQFMLYRLGYFPSFPDGQDTALYQSAVKQFQAAMHVTVTGNLTVEQWKKLVMEYNYSTRNIPLKQIYPTSYQFTQQGDLVEIKGTWHFTDTGLQMMAPIQASDIRCDKTKNICAEARALLVNFTSEDLLDAQLIAWPVTKWDDTEIIAENDSAECIAYTLYINLKKQTASQTRRGKNCFGVASEPMTMELVDGKQVADEYYHQQMHRHESTSAPATPINPVKM